MRLLAAILVLLAFGAQATTWYVTQNGGGTGTNSLAWLNAASNYPPSGSIHGGDTVQMEGTFTNQFTPHSGSFGSPIIFNGSNAIFSRPTWGSGISKTETDSVWYVPSGEQLHDNIYRGHVITCTSNGTGRMFTNSFFAIYGSPWSNVWYQNLTITNMGYYIGSTQWVQTAAFSNYITCYGTNADGSWNVATLQAYHTNNCTFDSSGDPPITWKYPPASVEGVYLIAPGTPFKNIHVENCYIDQCIDSIKASASINTFSDGFYIISNYCAHGNWGIGVLGSPDNCSITNLVVLANIIENQTNWNSNNSPGGNDNDNPNHGDGGFISWNSHSGTNWNMKVQRNRFGPNLGNLVSAALYMDEVYSANNFRDAQIDNNIFDLSGVDNNYPAVVINGDNVLFANNTGKSASVASDDGFPLYRPTLLGQHTFLILNSAGARSPRLTNNLGFYFATAVAGLGQVTSAMGADYNTWVWPPNNIASFDAQGVNGIGFGRAPNNSTIGQWGDWTNGVSADLRGGYCVTNLTMSSYYISTNMAAEIAGVSMASFYTTDFYGVTRTNWTRGAIESAGVVVVIPPNYTFTFTNGIGAGTYTSNATVTATASSGLWSSWGGDLAGVTSSNYNFSIRSNTTAWAIYTNAPVIAVAPSGFLPVIIGRSTP